MLYAALGAAVVAVAFVQKRIIINVLAEANELKFKTPPNVLVPHNRRTQDGF